MALRKRVRLTNNFGGQSEIDCYIRVASVTLTKANARVRLDLFDFGQNHLVHQDAVELEIDPEKPNVAAQVYSYLKTLPSYVGAEDC